MSDIRQVLDKDLNPTQQRILEHIFHCREDDYTSHIANAIEIAQPHVDRSVKDLLQRGYVSSDEKKNYELTRKGLGVAYLLTNDYDLLLEYSKMHSERDYNELVYLTKYIDLYEKRKAYVTWFFEYAYQYGFLERMPTPKEAKRFQSWIANKGLMEFDEPNSLKDMMTTYGFTKRTLREGIEESEKRLKLAKEKLKYIDEP